jgi:hypothetical protein
MPHVRIPTVPLRQGHPPDLSDQAQEPFFKGHIEAFNEMVGMPVRHIRYDNLTSAVTAVVFGKGRQRQENDRWLLFRSHYGFDAFYCQPGIAGAHERRPGGSPRKNARMSRRDLNTVLAVKLSSVIPK